MKGHRSMACALLNRNIPCVDAETAHGCLETQRGNGYTCEFEHAQRAARWSCRVRRLMVCCR